jgi:hypothetical protein
MILNRFSQAILEQNWFTVALEILIVVIGIFLGLQVDDWNEAREDRQQEVVYLGKLTDDLSTMRTDLVLEMEKIQERVDRMREALYVLEACDDSPQALAEVKYTLEHYQMASGVNYLDATYNEMVASGALARIKDQQLKQKISYTYLALGGMSSRFLSFRCRWHRLEKRFLQRGQNRRQINGYL